DVAGCELRELRAKTRAHFGGHERIGISKRRGLLLDSANHPLIAVSDVDAHQLAIEVNEPLSLRRPEVDSFRARDRNRLHCGLGGPLKDCVPAAEINDLLARHGFRNGSHRPRMLLKSPTIDNVNSSHVTPKSHPGSGWMFQILSTKEYRRNRGIPPTG